MKNSKLTILVGTRKGAWLLHGDAARRQWRADGPHFLGHIINHLVLDPRDGKTLLAAASTGHLGPTIFRSAGPGEDLAGSEAAAGVSESAGRPARRQRPAGAHGQAHLLADAGPRQPAGRLVRGHLAPGHFPQRRRR